MKYLLVTSWLGLLVGCRGGAANSPEILGRAEATGPSPTVVGLEKAPGRSRPHATPKHGARFALATPNLANGWIELVLSDRPTACGPHRPLPETCERAWRVRIDLAPEQQRVGAYRLTQDGTPFSYLDAQGPSAGAWGAGTQCQNLGGSFEGLLEITAIEPDAITGVLTGAGAADGPFRAERCSACKGTGLTCTSNGECCNGFCWNEKCQP